MFITNFLLGRARLSKAYWLVGGLGGSLFGGMVWLSVAVGAFPPGFGFALGTLYTLWATIAIWTCAHNVDWVGWTYLARISAVSTLAWLAYETYQVLQLD